MSIRSALLSIVCSVAVAVQLYLTDRIKQPLAPTASPFGATGAEDAERSKRRSAWWGSGDLRPVTQGPSRSLPLFAVVLALIHSKRIGPRARRFMLSANQARAPRHSPWTSIW